VIADASDLDNGYYTTSLTVSSPADPNGTITIDVVLSVHSLGILNVPEEFLTIQDAINVAANGDTVVVADGTYTGLGNKNLDFLGKAITVRSANGPQKTIIDCQYDGAGFAFERGEGPESIVDGFTITHANGEDIYYYGAITCYAGFPTITNCIITNNAGSGIYQESFWWGPYLEGNLRITNCTITNNKECGIVYGGNIAIDNCTIKHNTSSDWWYSSGGISIGPFDECYGPITISNSLISENFSTYSCGGIFACGNAKVINCIISGNRTLGGSMEAAGGIACAYANASILNCVITGNVSSRYAGGISCYSGSTEIKNCVIRDNEAAIKGSQIYVPGNTQLEVDFCNVSSEPNAAVVSGSYATLIWGEDNIDTDPTFSHPGHWDPNGTPTNPNDDFWVAGDYHLSWLSPCFNAGDPNRDYTGQTDMDGAPRVRYGRPDLGVYEVFPLGCDFEPDGDVDIADFASFSTVWTEPDCNEPADFSGNCLVDLSDLLIFAEYWLVGAGETIGIELALDNFWMYQNLPGRESSNLTASVSIAHDPLGNISYTYEWEFILPDDVTVEPATIGGGGAGDIYWNFTAPNVNQPQGLSDSGQAITVRVTVTGADFGNTGIAEAQFGIALLGDVNNDKQVNATDRGIINVFWRLGAVGPFTFTDCNLNCDTDVNGFDRSIANAVWRGVLGQNSVTSPCPLR